MEALAPLAGVFFGVVDIVLLVLTTLDAHSTSILSLNAWRALFTGLALVGLLWAGFFYVDSRHWCLCHYSTYRIFVTSFFVSAAMMTALVWFAGDTHPGALIAYAVVYLLRLPALFGALNVWMRTDRAYWEAPLVHRSRRVFSSLDHGQLYAILRHRRANAEQSRRNGDEGATER